jgi:hypothetical protein
MRTTRPTIGSLGFVVLFLAVDLAVMRGVFLDDRPGPGAVFAFFLLPMVDALLIAAYRLGNPGGRTPRAVGFLVAGSVATAWAYAGALLAPRAIEALIAHALRPPARALFAGLTNLLGDAAMGSRAIRLTIGVGFEVLAPAALFCGPPLVVAMLGGWVGQRVGGRPTATRGIPGPRRAGSSASLIGPSAR